MDNKNPKKEQSKWTKPTVKSISFQELSSLITAAACSWYLGPCSYHMR